jgi:membrane protease YdiL (CAAX protease family)
MPSTPPVPSEHTAEQRRGSASIQLLAVALGPLPVYAITLARGVVSEQAYSPRAFILYTTAISGPIIIGLLLLLRYVCGENPRELNLKPGKWSSDLVAAVILSVVTLAANVLANGLLAELLPAPPNTAVINLFRWLGRSPSMLALFLGVLLWIGVAQEELTRVFLLSRLWKVWPSTAAKLGAVVFAAVLFGLAHYYQGPTRIVWTGIYGLIMGLYYVRFGRVGPLMISHYLTEALMVVVFVLRMPPG